MEMAAATTAATTVAKAAGLVVAKPLAEKAAESIGLNTAKRWVNGSPHIPVQEDIANIFLKNTIKYIFYENFIKGKSPDKAQLDTMLYLIAVTIDKGNIKLVLNSVIGEDDSTKLDQFYNRDYSFLGDEQKIQIITILMNSDPGISSSLSGGGKTKRKRKTNRRKTKRRKTMRRKTKRKNINKYK
jgi:hypothetical protein